MKKIREKFKNRKGHTLAEFLIAAGILAILLGIGMVAVVQYQKSLKLMEMDNTAKEIFIAAQNHITALKASGEWDGYEGKGEGFFGQTMTAKPSDYVGTEEDPWPEGGKNDKHHFYRVIYNPADPGESNDLDTSILKGILPENSIDEHVRKDIGSYVIEYDYETASVYSVFYTDNKNHMSYADADKINGFRMDKEKRKDYKNQSGKNVIIGYYGGTAGKNLKPVELTAPKIEVFNEETLRVQITDDNYFKSEGIQKATDEKYYRTEITLIIKGQQSDEEMEFLLKLEDNINEPKKAGSSETWWEVKGKKADGKLIYTIALDDITKQKGHFGDICKDLIPGEDITVSAKITTTNVLANTLYSAGKSTNSLFAARNDKDTGDTVNITHIRHLMNLNTGVSNLPVQIAGQVKSLVTAARQTKDIDWNEEKDWEGKKVESDKRIFKDTTKIYNKNNSDNTKEGRAYSIFNSALIEYRGNGHTISNFSMQPNAGEKNAGLFSTISKDSSSSASPSDFTADNLTLENFSVSGISFKEGNMGALAGEVAKDNILKATNIIVKNPTIHSNQGAAGGLVGKLDNGEFTGCGIYLSGTKEEKEEKYKNGTFGKDGTWESIKNTKCHVFAETTGAVGGLVGEVGKEAKIGTSFASIPVLTEKGNAGGLVGQAAQLTVKNSYAGGFTQEGGQYNEKYYNIVQKTGSNDNATGGLVGVLQGKGTIENSYSTCYVHGNIAGGLVGKDDRVATANAYLNCYSTGKVEGSTAENAGAFVGKVTSTPSSVKGCYYLSAVNKNMKAAGAGTLPAEVKGVKSSDLASAAFTGENAPENAAADKNHETYCYDSKFKTENTYPFATVNTTEKEKSHTSTTKTTGVHYGDWPEVEDNFDPEMAYYEIYKTGSKYTIGFYNEKLGIDTLNKNTSDSYDPAKPPATTIMQDGYVLLSEDQEICKVDLGTDKAAACHKASDIRVRGSKDALETLSLEAGGKGIVTGLAQNFIDTTATLKLTKEEYEDKSYYLQFLDLSVVDAVSSSENYYSRLKVNNAAESMYFYVNPHYAKSLVLKWEDETQEPSADKLKIPESTVIRTERQYSMFTQDLQNPSDSNKVFKIYQSLEYAQQRDLIFGTNTAYTSDYLGKKTAESLGTGSVPALLPVSAAANTDMGSTALGFSGTYDGLRKDSTKRPISSSITGLSISQSENRTAGMFGNTQGASIHNLTLNNIEIDATMSQGVGGLVGCATYAGDKFTLIEKVSITGANIRGGSSVGGLVGAGYDCTVNTEEYNAVLALNFTSLTGGIVQGNYLVGGVFGYYENTDSGPSSSEITVRQISTKDMEIKESDTHTQGNSYGIGGFAGKVNIVSSKPVNCVDITLRDSTITVDGNTNTTGNDKIAGALWVGSLSYAENTLAGGKEVLSYLDCSVKGLKLTTSATGASSYFGGIYGCVSGYGQFQSQFTLRNEEHKDILIGGNSIVFNGATTTGANVCGGLVGQITKIHLLMKGAYDGFQLPTISGFSANVTKALGGAVGWMNQAVFDNGSEYALGNIALPEGVSALYYGGFVGLADNSLIKNITMTGASNVNSQVVELPTASLGAIVGRATNSTIQNVAVAKSEQGILLDKIQAKYFGSIVGSAETTKLADIRVSGNTIQNKSQNVGGAVGHANKCAYGNMEASTISVRGEHVKDDNYSNEANIGGLIGSSKGGANSATFSASNVIVEGEGSYNNAGSLIGRSENDTFTTLSAEEGEVSIPAVNKGGAIGKFVNSSSTGMTVKAVHVSGKGNNVGGAIGYHNDAKSVQKDLTVTGVVLDGIEQLDADACVGGAIGRANGGTCQGVTVNGQITTTAGAGNANVGGIIGYALQDGTLEAGTFTSLKLDEMTLNGNGKYFGGIVGNVSKGNFKECSIRNKLRVTASGEACGGMAGFISTGNFEDIKIGETPENEGNPVYEIAASGNLSYVGGFAGEITEQQPTFKQCLVQNLTITGSDRIGAIGGFVGYLKKHLTNLSVQDVVIANGKNVGGLVGVAESAAVQNCDVRLPSIAGNESINQVQTYGVSSTTPDSNVGGLVGAGIKSSFTQCFAAIPVSANGNSASIGGLAGNLNASSVEFSYASCDVTNLQNGDSNTGGFSGFASNDTQIYNCYATGDVAGGSSLGGFLGQLTGETAYMNNCYSLGTVAVPDTTAEINFGGFIGSCTATKMATKKTENGTVQRPTGCVFLKDKTLQYNQRKWPDEENLGYVTSKTFSGFTNAADNQYVEDLNTDVALKGSSIVQRFAFSTDPAQTHRYDKTLPQMYPFPSICETVGSDTQGNTHWGDWPEQPEQPESIGLIYYEKMQGDTKTLYYNGWAKAPEDDDYTPLYSDKEFITEPNYYVQEDGYLLLLPKNVGAEDVSMYLGNLAIPGDLGVKLEEAKNITLPASLDTDYTPYFIKGADKLFDNDEMQIGFAINDKRIDFIMTPYFADSVKKAVPVDGKEKIHKIRSARQLGNLVNLTGYTGNGDNLFIQGLDISFSKNDVPRYSYQGVTVPCEFKKPINAMYADYKVATYKQNGDVCGYVINGMESNMFQSINSGALIQGVTLTDLQISSSAGEMASGFVQYNNKGGIIDSCSIRARAAGENSYEAVKISGASAGFVGQNSGSISNSYIAGTLSGDGVSGFCRTNGGEIFDCYANVIIDSTAVASGFCGNNDYGGTISGCHTLGKLKVSGYGWAFGFLNSQNGKISDCYSAISEIEATVIYRFASSYVEVDSCDYYSKTVIHGTAYDDAATSKTFAQLVEKAKEPYSATENTTHKYSEINKDGTNVYPFSLPYSTTPYLTMQHWGDWPEGQPELTEPIGLIYYETIKGKDTFYYHGYTGTPDGEYSLLESGGLITDPGNYVTGDGYLLLLPASVDAKGIDISIGGAMGGSLDKANIELPDALKQYTPYYIKGGEAQFRNGEQQVSFTINDETTNFTMTPYFADSVKGPKPIIEEQGNIYYIRSARHLKNLAAFELSEYAGTGENSFIQNLDISFSDASAKDYNYQGTTVSYGFTEPISVMAADYKAGIYDVGSDSGNAVCGYAINGMQSNMFDTIYPETNIQGVTLTDLQVSSFDKGGRSVGFVTTNFGNIESCSIRASENTQDSYGRVNIGKASSSKSTAGFVVNNNGVIRNSYIAGTLSGNNVSGFCRNNSGTISDSYTNVIIDCAEDADGFCYENSSTARIENCHALGTLDAPAGNAFGFMNNNEGTLENCYSAMSEITANGIYLFGTSNVDESQDCFYYSETVTNGTLYTTSDAGSSKTYDELAQQEISEFPATEATTHKYGVINEDGTSIYPFSLPHSNMQGSTAPYLTMQHWGDWPERQESPIGLIYYEKIKGDENLYYRGYKTLKGDYTLLESGDFITTPGTYVNEDGYLLLLPKGVNSTEVGIYINHLQDSTGSASLTEAKIQLPDSLSNDFTPYYIVGGEGQFNEGEQEIEFEISGKKTAFIMTPYFADSVKTERQEGTRKKYNIRSARQLKNLAALQGEDGYAQNSGNLFIQSLDISFSEESYIFNTPINIMSADYQVETYYSQDDGTVCGYVIDGMNSSMFGTITENTTIQGVTLTDLKVSSQVGFVTTNKGTIDSCSIRTQAENEKGYEDVTIDGAIAGFVVENYGVICNSYIVGTLNGQGYVSGFCQGNAGQIRDCYANVIINSNQNAYGFCYANYYEDSLTENCHALGELNAPNGNAYGFLDGGEGSAINCYTAMSEINAKTIYRFSLESGTSYQDCYYYSGTETLGKIIEGGAGSPLTFEELAAPAQVAGYPATEATTHKYNVINQDEEAVVYPFSLPYFESESDKLYLTMQHWGDWPEKVPELGKWALVYYEKIKDDPNLYYHGYNYKGQEVSTKSLPGTAENGLPTGSGKIVVDSGYLLLDSGGKSGIGEFKMLVDKDKGSGKVSDYFTGSSVSISGYVVQKLTKYTDFSKSGLSKVMIEHKSNKEALTVFMTPYFGDSLQLEQPESSDERRFYIRSGGHLENLRTVSGFAENPSNVFEQQLDIDASDFKGSISTFAGHYVVDTYKDAIDQPTNGFVIDGMKSPGMFTTVADTATIEGITLTNLDASGSGFGALVVENYGNILNCGVRTGAIGEEGYGNVKIGDGTGDVAGFVYMNYGTIENCYSSGTVTGSSTAAGFVAQNSGVIESSYANCVVIATNGNGFGFCCYNESEIGHCHALLSVDAEKGTAYGFIGENDGSLSECYAAMQNMEGNHIDSFGGDIPDDDNSTCYFIKDNIPATATYTGRAIDYDELKEMAVRGNSVATEKTTKKYGFYNTVTEDKVYPFPMPSESSGTAQITMQHYGDWPMKLPNNLIEDEGTEIIESLETPESPDAVQEAAFSAGLACYETDGGDYQGWYAVYRNSADPGGAYTFNSMAEDSGQLSAQRQRTFGILMSQGAAPECSEFIGEAAASVEIEGTLYDFYPFADNSQILEGREVSIKVPGGETTMYFIPSEDFYHLASPVQEDAVIPEEENGDSPIIE